MMYNAPFEITQCWIYNRVTFQMGAINFSYNIHFIKPYKFVN